MTYVQTNSAARLAVISALLLVGAPAEGKKVGDPVPDTFICTLAPGPVSVTPEAYKAAQQAQGHILHIYTRIFNGFAIRATQSAIARVMARNSLITACTQSFYVSIPPAQTSAAASRSGGKPVSGSGEIIDWGVQRVGGPDLNTDGTMKTYSRKAYVVDTGVDLTHPELNVNLGLSKSFLSAAGTGNDTANDYNGHGSHVAGVIAAKANKVGIIGVAPGATVISVRVLDATGSAPDADVLAGLNYILSSSAQASTGDVVNLSLVADPKSTLLDSAVSAMGNYGLKVVMAAGNTWQNVDTAQVSPAYLNGPNLFTVSAFKKGDYYSYPSNSGPSVDFAEPGENIYSLDKNGGYTTKSGTSMAAPHLSGILLVAGSAVASGKTLKPTGFFGDPDGVYDTIGKRP